MAARQAEIRGRGALTDALLVPRRVTRVLLLCICVVAAQLAWEFLPVKLLAYIAGVAGPFCLLCAGAVWSIRDKADGALSGDGLPVSKFKAYREAARVVRARVFLKSSYVAVCALFAVSPAISNQLAGPIWHWMLICSGIGVAEAAYGYLTAHAWEEELIDLKERHLESAKADAERQQLIDRLSNSSKLA